MLIIRNATLYLMTTGFLLKEIISYCRRHYPKSQSDKKFSSRCGVRNSTTPLTPRPSLPSMGLNSIGHMIPVSKNDGDRCGLCRAFCFIRERGCQHNRHRLLLYFGSNSPDHGSYCSRAYYKKQQFELLNFQNPT